MRNRTLAMTAALALGLAALAACDGDASAGAGLEVGSKCRPFDVFDATGPNKGKMLCYV